MSPGGGGSIKGNNHLPPDMRPNTFTPCKPQRGIPWHPANRLALSVQRISWLENRDPPKVCTGVCAKSVMDLKGSYEGDLRRAYSWLIGYRIDQS